MEPIFGMNEKQTEPVFRMKGKEAGRISDPAEKNAASRGEKASEVSSTKGQADVQDPEKETKGNGSVKPLVDEFVREEHMPAGLYRMEKDEDGNPKIYFDDPDQAAGEKDEIRQEDPERVSGKKGEICRGSTDKVDREIEKLKKKKEELEAKLNTETDESKKKELESRLAQVERELRQKDNDTYRRRHTVFS